jgi:hypothetical protein
VKQLWDKIRDLGISITLSLQEDLGSSTGPLNSRTMDATYLSPDRILKKPVKRVSFTQDTNSGLGRAYMEYYRSDTNKKYKPGLHAASEDRVFSDTSFFQDVYFNCTQLKVFTGTQKEVDILVDSYDIPPRNEGIAEHHPRREELIEMLEDEYEGDDEELERDLEKADWILLAVEDSMLFEVILHETWDVEDFDNDPELSVPSDEGKEAVTDEKNQDLESPAQADKIVKHPAGEDQVVDTSKRVRHCGGSEDASSDEDRA